jgi:hypothetical protein
MHASHAITCLVAAATVLAGCGRDEGGGQTVATTPQAQRSVEQAGAITVRGDFAPDRHGPYVLHGRYRVRFRQHGAGVDFRTEVPFTAHLEEPVTGGPGNTIKLFQNAAPTGATTTTADGRFDVVIDYGDSPYELVLTPAAR